MKLKPFTWVGKRSTLRILCAILLGLELDQYEARFPHLVGIAKA